MVWIDKERCRGCGICKRVCPSGFEMKDRVAVIKDSNASCINKAMMACPFEAIQTETKEKVNINPQHSPVNRISMGGFGMGRGMGRGPHGGRGWGRR